MDERQEIIETIGALLRSFSSEDKLLIKLIFLSGHKISAAARLLKQDERLIYRRLAGKYNNELESRKGTDRDTYTLYTLYQQDPAAADARAQEMFGTAGITIMRKVEAMYDHNRAMTGAVADWRKGSATRAKEAQLAQEKQFSRVMEIWKDQIDREKSTSPDIYDFTSDPKLAGIFKRSEAFADAAFRPDPQIPLEDTVRHQAKVRSLAALAPALLGKVAKLEADLEAAKAALSEYEGGKPHVKPTGESQKPVEKKHSLSLR